MARNVIQSETVNLVGNRLHNGLYKNAPNSSLCFSYCLSYDKIPKSAFWLSALKTLEETIHQSSDQPTSFYPIWFLAQTEVDTFLWKNSHSLDNKDDFEFWLDLRALIKKRLRQLENQDNLNRDLILEQNNGKKELNCQNSDERKNYLAKEITYLQSFWCTISSILPHLHAYSIAASKVINENSQDRRPMIILPVGQKD